MAPMQMVDFAFDEGCKAEIRRGNQLLSKTQNESSGLLKKLIERF
jgi:hypothetical protein